MAKSICSIAGCGKFVWGRGWCQKHYTRWRTHGDPLAAKRDLTLADEQRFWARVDKSAGPDACWPWTGSHSDAGRGYFSVKSVDLLATRWLWASIRGPIPEGSVIRHKCDNPPCVNPTHLEIGTQLDNIDDREKRGRTAKGTEHYTAKLNPDSVRAIRAARRAGISRPDLAEQFGVTRSAIHGVESRRTWKHVL